MVVLGVRSLNWAGELLFQETKRLLKIYNPSDVLLTLQPSIGNLGKSWDPIKQLIGGSDRLRVNLKDKNILVNFSGHVHLDHEQYFIHWM